MYASILEDFELNKEEGLSFLNIGSGSGYLNCLVSALVGRSGISHGIDINPSVVEHSIEATNIWLQELEKMKELKYLDCLDKHDMVSNSISNKSPVSQYTNTNNKANIIPISCSPIEYIHGNCFEIISQTATTPNPVYYDRIFVGASCALNQWKYFLSRLHPNNGIMIIPIEFELVKITRICIKPDEQTEVVLESENECSGTSCTYANNSIGMCSSRHHELLGTHQVTRMRSNVRSKSWKHSLSNEDTHISTEWTNRKRRIVHILQHHLGVGFGLGLVNNEAQSPRPFEAEYTDSSTSIHKHDVSRETDDLDEEKVYISKGIAYKVKILQSIRLFPLVPSIGSNNPTPLPRTQQLNTKKISISLITRAPHQFKTKTNGDPCDKLPIFPSFAPRRYPSFPKKYRNIVRMLCNGPVADPTKCSIPRCVTIYILSFTHRDWFDVNMSFHEASTVGARDQQSLEMVNDVGNAEPKVESAPFNPSDRGGEVHGALDKHHNTQLSVRIANALRYFCNIWRLRRQANECTIAAQPSSSKLEPTTCHHRQRTESSSSTVSTSSISSSTSSQGRHSISLE